MQPDQFQHQGPLICHRTAGACTGRKTRVSIGSLCIWTTSSVSAGISHSSHYHRGGLDLWLYTGDHCTFRDARTAQPHHCEAKSRKKLAWKKYSQVFAGLLPVRNLNYQVLQYCGFSHFLDDVTDFFEKVLPQIWSAFSRSHQPSSANRTPASRRRTRCKDLWPTQATADDDTISMLCCALSRGLARYTGVPEEDAGWTKSRTDLRTPTWTKPNRKKKKLALVLSGLLIFSPSVAGSWWEPSCRVMNYLFKIWDRIVLYCKNLWLNTMISFSCGTFGFHNQLARS